MTIIVPSKSQIRFRNRMARLGIKVHFDRRMPRDRIVLVSPAEQVTDPDRAEQLGLTADARRMRERETGIVVLGRKIAERYGLHTTERAAEVIGETAVRQYCVIGKPVDVVPADPDCPQHGAPCPCAGCHMLEHRVPRPGECTCGRP